MADYQLRNVPSGLWARVKARAQSEGRSLRYILVTLLEKYAKEGL